jgi:L-amino acid N-acyltransferase YncA/DNA-binding transcriptional ArsR family regulator
MDAQEEGPLHRVTAAEYASWFRALADATRVQIVSLLARCGEPMTVGAITAELEIGQSTVSEHLEILAGVRFVLADRHGTTTHYRINEACVRCFPSAADIVMGRPVPVVPSCTTGTVTAAQYRHQLLAAGFTQLSIVPAADAGGGLSSAVIRAVRPAAPDGVLIRPMRTADSGEVLAIYQAGLDTGQASFETAAPTWETFDAGKLPLHRYVAADAVAGRLLGWVAVSPVSARRVYEGVVEHSVYVDPACHRGGIGWALLSALIASAEAAGIWTIQSSVFPENAASMRLHQKAGFRVIGTRERIARHHGRWRDTALLERRSTVAGTG